MADLSLKTLRVLTATTAMGVIAAAGLAMPAPAHAETTLLFNMFLPAKHPFNSGMIQPWAKDVAKATHNRVKVQFTTSTLAPPTKQWNMITSGIADVAMLNNVFERNRLQLPPIAELPFGGDKAVQRSVALWRTSEKFFGPAHEYKGVKLLTLWAISGTDLFLAEKPVTRLQDLKDMKIWTNPGTPKDIFSALGAVVVTSPGVKIFDFVSKGIVDGLVAPPYFNDTFKLNRYLKYGTKMPGGFYSAAFSMFMNEKKWNSLSPEDQKAIMSVSGEVAARNAGNEVDKLDVLAAKSEMKAGIKVTVANPQFVSNVRDRTEFVTTKWLENAKKRGIDGPAALEYFKSQSKMIGEHARVGHHGSAG